MFKLLRQIKSLRDTDRLKRKLTTETLDYDLLREVAISTDRYIEVILPGATIKIYNREYQPVDPDKGKYY